MNEEHAESLLREYLIRHPPRPFQDLVGVGSDPRQKNCLVFRYPGTLCDLVIATKFVPNRQGNVDPTTRGRHWEHALYGGMAWRQNMRHFKLQKLQERSQEGWEFTSPPRHSNRNQGRPPLPPRTPTPQKQKRNRARSSDINVPPSLIIAATFTNQYGLELVGHVEESPMEDVQFRLVTISSSSPMPASIYAALQYTTILDGVMIYRWQSYDHESVWNVIGFVASAGSDGANPNENNTVAASRGRLCLKSLSRIVKRNNKIPSSDPVVDSYHQLALFLSSPTSNTCGSLTPKKFMPNERQIDSNDNQPRMQIPITLDNPILSRFLQRVMDTRRLVVSPNSKLNLSPSIIETPSPYGPFYPPYRCWEIQWEKGPLDDNAFHSSEVSGYPLRQKQNNCLGSAKLNAIATASHNNVNRCGKEYNQAVSLYATPPRHRQRLSPPAADRSNLRAQSCPMQFNRHECSPGVNSCNPARVLFPIPEKTIPIQELSSIQRNLLTERSKHIPAIVHDQPSTPSPPQQGALVPSNQRSTNGRSRIKMPTCTILNDEDIVLDNYHLTERSKPIPAISRPSRSHQDALVPANQRSTYDRSRIEIPSYTIPDDEDIVLDNYHLTERSKPLPAIGRPSRPQQDALVSSNQRSTYDRSRIEKQIGTIDNMLDAYNVLGFLFDENKAGSKRNAPYIRDHCGLQRDPKSKGKHRRPFVNNSKEDKFNQRISKRSRRRTRRFRKRQARERVTAEQNVGTATKHTTITTTMAPSITKDVLVESRSDGFTHTFRREADGNKKARLPSKGDVAINLLCPYHHCPDKSFQISHETPQQRALRREIEGSACCRHLMGQFVMEFISKPRHSRAAGRGHEKYRVRKL